MRKVMKTLFVAAVLVALTAVLAACNATGGKAEYYADYSAAIAAGLDTENFYIKYSEASAPDVTYKLNYYVEDGLIRAQYDRETRGTVSTAHEYIYFGHALPAGIKESEAADADRVLKIFRYDLPAEDASVNDFFETEEISGLLPETFLSGLDLSEENIVEIPGVPFASVRGEVTTFSFAVSNASGAYSEYTGEDNYLIVRSIQGRVNKITDSRGTFTIYFDYAGPNISMPAF